MDCALIESGRVVQVWRGQTQEQITNLDELLGEIVAFPPGIVVCGQFYDSATRTLTDPPPDPVPEFAPATNGTATVVTERVIEREPAPDSGLTAELLGSVLADMEQRLRSELASAPSPEPIPQDTSAIDALAAENEALRLRLEKQAADHAQLKEMVELMLDKAEAVVQTVEGT